MIIRALARLALALPLAAAAADPAEGKRLVEASQCEACHQDKARGPAGTIYVRKGRIVTSLAKLKAQVSACNTELNLGLFPDDEDAIVAWLDARYYRFAAK